MRLTGLKPQNMPETRPEAKKNSGKEARETGSWQPKLSAQEIRAKIASHEAKKQAKADTEDTSMKLSTSDKMKDTKR